MTMRIRLCAVVLLWFIAGCINAGGGPIELPRLEAKPYFIAIAPSHITVPPKALFESESRWAQVAKQTDLYKYYGVQLMLPRPAWASHLDPKAMVKFTKARGIKLGCEFGNFRLVGEDIPDASKVAFLQLDPIFEAGGEVSSIHLDGSVRRMIKGIQKHPNAITMDEIAARMVDFWQTIRGKYPRIRIGLITNFPNWDYTRELVGYNGHFTDQSGITYSEALNTLHLALTEAGEKIDFVEVDCPYNYYREQRTRNNDADVDNARKFTDLQKWCKERDIRFNLIVNAEPRNEGAKGFHDLTCEYVRHLRRDGIFPDLFIVQSWYKDPSKHLPETEKHTFMNTAKDAITLIRKLYPSNEIRTNRSSGPGGKRR